MENPRKQKHHSQQNSIKKQRKIKIYFKKLQQVITYKATTRKNKTHEKQLQEKLRKATESYNNYISTIEQQQKATKTTEQLSSQYPQKPPKSFPCPGQTIVAQSLY